MKYYFIAICLLCAMACNDDSAQQSTKHPNGMNEGAVISTDTAAIKADSTEIKK